MPVTDQLPWQPPVPSTPVTATPSPATSPVPPPPAGYVTASPILVPGTPAPTGWTPPPKPGLLPLRPLGLGTILGAPFRLMRRNPRPTLGIALALQAVVLVVSGVVIGLISAQAFARIDSSLQSDSGTIEAGSLATLYLSLLVPVLLSLFVSALVQAVIVLEVSRQTLGEKLRFGRLWARVRGRLGAVIGWTFLVVLFVILWYLLVVLLVVLAVLIGSASLGAGIGLGIIFVLGAIVLGVWLAVKLSLTNCAIVLERASVGRAMGRSWRLTTGAVPFWKTLGIEALVGAILYFGTSILTFPVSFLGGIFSSLLDPNGAGSGSAVAISIVILVITGVVALVAGAVASVIVSATTALIYLDQRMRKEGLDLDLARFVEARQAGIETVQDPYLRPAAATAPAA
jgi:hypothetical protein